MKKRPHFKALLTFLPTEDGGIATPVSSGFRTAIQFPFDSREFLANHTFLEIDLVFPGDIINVDITLLDSGDALEKAYEGLDFELLLNSNLIGSGTIAQLYPELPSYK